MKVVILCGGKGIRLNNSLDFIPKAMVKIGHRPLIWHVMKMYAQFGFSEFVLATGLGGEMIRDYFIDYNKNVNDVTLTLGDSKVEFNTQNQEENWKITFVETGEESGTGTRLFRCQKYLNNEDFFVAYADCLSDINIADELEFHKKNNKVATISGVMPPFRYGEFIMESDHPTDYNITSHLKSQNGWVNGGTMILTGKIFDYLTPYNEYVLETDVFKKLVTDKQVSIFEHTGFWQCLDNDREYAHLNMLCANNSEYWLFKK